LALLPNTWCRFSDVSVNGGIIPVKGSIISEQGARDLAFVARFLATRVCG